MSHFLVAVVGKNPHEMLAPFREYDAGEDDPYVKLVDVTDGAKQTYEVYVVWKRDRGDVYDASLKEHLLEYEMMSELPYGTDVSSLDAVILASKRRFFTVTETGDVDRVYRYTNPDGKWDWYDASGGRWREIFKYKDYDVVDAEDAESEDDEIPKSGYDFEAMRAAAIRQEHERWDVMEPLLTKYTWVPWETVRERYSDEDINHARGFYHSQKGLQRVRKISNFSSLEDMDRYLSTNRQDAVALAAMKAIPCRAYIKDGQWHGRWNGQEDIPVEQWFKELNEMIESLPDDTVLTFVDCHI